MPKKRSRPKRRLGPVLHIFCEGDKTEPNYINGYLDKFFPGNRSMKVIKVEPTKKNTPEQLVDEAVKMKNNSPSGDVFWTVYDRESEQKHSSSLHVNAYNKAKGNNVEIALSNVCFEVWIVLHFEETAGPYHCYDDLRKKSPLRRHLPDYNKSDSNVFRKLEERVEKARERAVILNRNTKSGADPAWNRPYQWNPYTDVHKLLDAIDAFSEDLINSK